MIVDQRRWAAVLRRALALCVGAVLLTGATGLIAGYPATGGWGSASAPVWLCRPGVYPDPCVSNLDAQAVSASRSRALQTAAPASSASRFDCFYVYPTISQESGRNSDLTVQPVDRAVARSQAARFSAVCRVWAPMYRQVTLKGLYTGGRAAVDTAYASVLDDWRYYLSHYNDGRPIVLIGHSQGAAMLIRLTAEQIDPDPALRRRLVVAILAGGNLQVPTGQTVGAAFRNIPLCTSTTRAGCAIAYSTFGSEPPPDTLFGRPGQGVSLMSLQTTSAGQQVACVNPADLAALAAGTGHQGQAGRAATLIPYFVVGGPAPWVTYPGLYTASCQSRDGATWLQVDTHRVPNDPRPVVKATLGPTWGYHAYDVNLALGNLVGDVSALEAAYRS